MPKRTLMMGITGQPVLTLEVTGSGALDVPALCGKVARAKADLEWEPTVGLEELVAVMVEADRTRVGDERR